MKNYVIAYRSTFAFFMGFMGYAFIALMKLSGLNSFQIGLVLSSIQISKLISYVVLIAFSLRRNLLVSALLELPIPILLIVDKSTTTFVLVAVFMGVTNSIISSVIIVQKDFTRKDYSVLMTLTHALSLAGLGMFYLSGVVGVNALLAFFVPLLILNSMLASLLKYEERKERLSELYHWLKGVGKSVLTFGFLASMRRVIMESYIPLVLLVTFSSYTPQEISLYLMLFQVPLIVFFYVGHKISDRSFLVLSITEFALFLTLSGFYRESILLALSLILLANVTSSLRAPIAEETVVKLLNFSTKISSFYQLMDAVFSAIAAVILAFVVKLGLFYGVFILAGLASFLPSLFLYEVLVREKR